MTRHPTAVETKSRARHIAGMSAKPHDRDKPSARQPAEKLEDTPGATPPQPREIGGPKGPEPTRYGDWEVNGRCTDF